MSIKPCKLTALLTVNRKLIHYTNMVNIKKYRLKLKLSQNAFAKLLNLSTTSIRSYELGLYNPSYSTLLRLKKLVKEKINEDIIL